MLRFFACSFGGFPQGLKRETFLRRRTARLKSCPDTKLPQGQDFQQPVGSYPRVRPAVAALLLATLPCFAYQQTGQTVRHVRVQEDADDAMSPDVAQAEAAMQKQDFASAEALLKKAVETNPNDYRAWFDLGYVNKQTGHTTAAIYAYRKSVAAKPDVFESNLNLGILLAQEGNKDDAARFLKAATQLRPTAKADEGLARAWQSYGLVLQDSEPQQALAAFAEAAKLEPKDVEPRLSAGAVLEKQGKLDGAAKEYEAAAALDAKSTDALIGLANVYSKQKKLPEAEAALRKVVALDPANDNARLQLGRVLAAEGKTDEAAPLLASAKGAADDPRAAIDRGTASQKAGDPVAAEEQFRAAVKAMPQDGEAHFALGTFLMEQKRYPEAQEELLIAVKLKPDAGEIYGNLAVVAAQNKNYQLAIKVLDERAKLLPEIPAAYFLRATSYDNLKMTPQAIQNYKQFLATDGGKMPDQEWQARHRLIAIDPSNASKYAEKK
jgi:Flp pilus assembly protein TadD